MLRFLVLLTASVFILGCEPPNMNVQRSALRTGGDLATTFYLDSRSANTVDADKAKVKEACEKLLTFMDTGNVANLPLASIRSSLKALVPVKYRHWVGQALAVVDMTNVPVGKIGAANVRRIKAFLKGAILGADEYLKTDRNSTTDATGVLWRPPTAHDPGSWPAEAEAA